MYASRSICYTKLRHFLSKPNVKQSRCLQRRWKATEASKHVSKRDAELLSMSLAEARDSLLDGKTTSTELVEASLRMIERTQPLYNQYISVQKEQSLKAAADFDQKRLKGHKVGRLAGLPIAVKDNFAVKDTPTTCASKMLQNFVAPYDATVVDRLKQQGGIMLGKTNMDEFAMGSDTIYSVNGPTINPWSTADKKYVAGGSSGGSAVAVACHTCYGALGSDTGGSVRLPASFTGLVGLKPSYGRTSRYGLVAYGSSLDCPALFSKTVQDAAILLDVISGEDQLDSTSVPGPAETQFENNLKKAKDLRGVRVGIPSEYNVAELSDEIRQFWKEGANWLKSHGAELVEVSLPHTKLALSAYYIIAPAEASSNLARYDGVRYGHRTQEDCATIKDMITKSRTEGFGSEVQRRIIVGTFALSRKSYESYYKKALEIRRLVLDDFKTVFRSKENPSGVDVLLTPTAPSSAGELKNALEKTKQNPVDLYLMDVMTIPANMAGIPAMSVPYQLSEANLPVGLQLMSNYFEEDLLFKVGSFLEKPWSRKSPNVLE